MTWAEQAEADARAAVWSGPGTWDEGVDHCLALIEPALRFDLGPVAEIGCGIGRLLHPLASRHHDCLFVGQDPTVGMIDRARAACPAVGRVAYQTGDWLEGGPYGSVYSVLTLQHLPPAVQATHLATAAIRLEAGGRLRVQWTPDGDEGPLCHPVAEQAMLDFITDRAALEVVDVEDDPIFPTWRWVTAEAP